MLRKYLVKDFSFLPRNVPHFGQSGCDPEPGGGNLLGAKIFPCLVGHDSDALLGELKTSQSLEESHRVFGAEDVAGIEKKEAAFGCFHCVQDGLVHPLIGIQDEVIEKFLTRVN
ncbi:MAG: hypothetical protein WA705_15835 [Candidatus Ozemobacteraceae bacterium]